MKIARRESDTNGREGDRNKKNEKDKIARKVIEKGKGIKYKGG